MKLSRLLLFLSLLCPFSFYAQQPADSTHLTDSTAFRINQYLVSLSVRKLQNEHECTIVFRNVNVVDAVNNTIIPHQLVIEHDGRIVQVGKNPFFFFKKHRKVIDGSGLYLAPGLTDMHVHFTCANRERLQFLLYGVTSIRNLTGAPYFLEDQKYIDEQLLLSPRLYTSGPALAGFSSDCSVKAFDDTTAQHEIQGQLSAGYNTLKLDRSLRNSMALFSLYTATVLNMHVAIELPEKLVLADVVRFGKHVSVEGFDGNATAEETRLAANAGVWVTPLLSATAEKTLHSPGYDDPLKTLSRLQLSFIQTTAITRYNTAHAGQNQQKQRFVKAYAQAGGHLLAGTEAGLPIPMLIPGASLHEELSELVKAGIPANEAILAATLNPAQAMDIPDAGIIAESKNADLLLLSANPLQNIENYKKIRGIMINGTWLSEKDLKDIQNTLSALR